MRGTRPPSLTPRRRQPEQREEQAETHAKEEAKEGTVAGTGDLHRPSAGALQRIRFLRRPRTDQVTDHLHTYKQRVEGPLELIAHVIKQRRPFSDIITTQELRHSRLAALQLPPQQKKRVDMPR